MDRSTKTFTHTILTSKTKRQTHVWKMVRYEVKMTNKSFDKTTKWKLKEGQNILCFYLISGTIGRLDR